jgi:hypothetical protein
MTQYTSESVSVFEICLYLTYCFRHIKPGIGFFDVINTIHSSWHNCAIWCHSHQFKYFTTYFSIISKLSSILFTDPQSRHAPIRFLAKRLYEDISATIMLHGYIKKIVTFLGVYFTSISRLIFNFLNGVFTVVLFMFSNYKLAHRRRPGAKLADFIPFTLDFLP